MTVQWEKELTSEDGIQMPEWTAALRLSRVVNVGQARVSLPISGNRLSVGDDDKLVLNVLRCRLTY